MGRWDLSGAEQRVWDAFSDRALVDLGNGTGDTRDGDKWGADRTVRGDVIAALLLGARRPKTGRVPAVRVAGARIVGPIDVSDGDVTASLQLTGCYLECAPAFDGATCRLVQLAGCVLPGFSGRLLHVRGSLRFESCSVRGSIVLRNGRIQGSLHLTGSRLDDAGQEALSAGGIQVDAGLYARRVHAEGAMRLIGGVFNGGVFMERARLRNPGGDTITGDGMEVRNLADLSGTVHVGTLSLRSAHVGSLLLEAATLKNPGGSALAAVGLRVDAVMSCEGFESTGQIQLYHARIGQHLSFERAILSNPGGVALWAEQLQAGELMLQTAKPPEGTIDLRDARIGVLHDDSAVWPSALRLAGLAYDSLDPPLTGSQRLDWLSRDPDGYIPSAYEQLSGMYRRIGHGEQARDVQLAKQRRRRQALPPASRAWGYLQDWAVGYGYRPGRAAAGLLLLWSIGTLAFSLHHPPPASDADPHTFQPVIYTLGLLLPVIDFQQEDTFTPQGTQSWLAFLLIAAGWILTTTVAAAIVRGLRGER